MVVSVIALYSKISNICTYNLGDSFELPAGEHNYKFEYTLPNGLPSTYNGTYGCIKYKIKAILDIPLGFDDEEVTILDITSPIDLNSLPHLKVIKLYYEIKNY